MRTKAKAESAALHAGLRKEQMKVESLERTLQQKVTHCPCQQLLLLPSASCWCQRCPPDFWCRRVLWVWVIFALLGFFCVL